MAYQNTKKAGQSHAQIDVEKFQQDIRQAIIDQKRESLAISNEIIEYLFECFDRVLLSNKCDKFLQPYTFNFILSQAQFISQQDTRPYDLKEDDNHFGDAAEPPNPVKDNNQIDKLVIKTVVAIVKDTTPQPGVESTSSRSPSRRSFKQPRVSRIARSYNSGVSDKMMAQQQQTQSWVPVQSETSKPQPLNLPKREYPIPDGEEDVSERRLASLRCYVTALSEKRKLQQMQARKPKIYGGLIKNKDGLPMKQRDGDPAQSLGRIYEGTRYIETKPVEYERLPKMNGSIELLKVSVGKSQTIEQGTGFKKLFETMKSLDSNKDQFKKTTSIFGQSRNTLKANQSMAVVNTSNLLGKFPPAQILHDNLVVNESQDNFKSNFGVTMTQLKPIKSQLGSRPLDESLDQSEEDYGQTYESQITVKGPEYHERSLQQGSIKMRRVDLLRRQIKEKEQMVEMYKAIGRKNLCESSLDMNSTSLIEMENSMEMHMPKMNLPKIKSNLVKDKKLNNISFLNQPRRFSDAIMVSGGNKSQLYQYIETSSSTLSNNYFTLNNSITIQESSQRNNMFSNSSLLKSAQMPNSRYLPLKQQPARNRRNMDSTESISKQVASKYQGPYEGLDDYSYSLGKKESRFKVQQVYNDYLQ
ncbi:hypothetical protein FGO68_gene8831 [Halteria grandinella]|uniref:Uncharacterized protein n=1 Tax=Halteria grandinella TaxID=5974 RepID=A0A8J8P110_HALGN|nr:hypothetical protein FGO68_gene8831 [Halteria grandinella]